MPAPNFPKEMSRKSHFANSPRCFIRLELGELLDSLAGPGKDTEDVETDLSKKNQC